MSIKVDILRKIRILITNQFDSPEEAFRFFDSDEDARLNKFEIKKMLRAAEINGFISGFVANELLKGHDTNSDDTINWEEFKVAIAELERDL